MTNRATSGSPCSGRRLIDVTTVALTHRAFLRRSTELLQKHGWELHAAFAPDEEYTAELAAMGIQVHPIPMQRRSSPLSDLRALLRLILVMRAVRPAIVRAHTPKAGLLGIVAALLSRQGRRIFVLHGLRSDGLRGIRRLVMSRVEMLNCALANEVLCVSPSLADRLSSTLHVRREKVHVLGFGSVTGVDTEERFNPWRIAEHDLRNFRQAFSLPPESLIIGYVGRIARDKGIEVLCQAMQYVFAARDDVWLLVIGGFDDTDPIGQDAERFLRSHPRVVLTGELHSSLPLAIRCCEIVVLPTFREGLGMSALEASALARPVVSTSVTGVVDAVLPGVTGMLVPPGDATALADAISAYVLDPELRMKHGLAGRSFVQERFRESDVLDQLERHLDRALATERGGCSA